MGNARALVASGRFWGGYLVLIVPLLNWLVGCVFILLACYHCLSGKPRLGRLLAFAIGSAVWAFLSLYIGLLEKGQMVLGLAGLAAFLVWTWIMLAWTYRWPEDAEIRTATVEVNGRIES